MKLIATITIMMFTATFCKGQSTKINVTVNGHTLVATLEDNSTTRAIIERLPMTLPMMDLYGREMCYRFPDALPTDNAYSQGYEVGEIVYYPPMHSFVIMYAQNGEHFQMQKLGRIDSGIEIFDGIGDVEVKFELQGTTTSISKANERTISVKASGKKIAIEGKGKIIATAYNTGGMVIGIANGKDSAEIVCQNHKGLAVVEVLDDNGNMSRAKIMIE